MPLSKKTIITVSLDGTEVELVPLYQRRETATTSSNSSSGNSHSHTVETNTLSLTPSGDQEPIGYMIKLPKESK